ncbi:integrase [Pseudomonas moraviensis]|uniref:integrase n=1 Tax=Pseudomonas moraviensis TaxID=321662 RepID=UPI002092F71D|nr:integrase [Pseudomonas moraviensis]UST68626.1 integrase [Pseudomonas moraviensis]
MSSSTITVGSLFASDNFPASSVPDGAASESYIRPSDDFILCRDVNGQPTAVYGELVWDFNPYRLSAKKLSRIRFDTVFADVTAEDLKLIEECKHILYCLIYFSGGGRIGRLSASTLMQYWAILRLAVKFCKEQQSRKLVGRLSLRQLFTVPIYLAAFISQVKIDGGFLSGVIKGLVRVGKKRLGYEVVNPRKFDLKRPPAEQHPVIPTRIYLNVINRAGDMLDHICKGVLLYEKFIACFSDGFYGSQHNLQKSHGVGGRNMHRPDMLEAIREHGLEEVFVDVFSCTHKRSLQKVLLRMQHVLKVVIHIYTGMRDQEVLRMPYSCLSKRVVRKPAFDDHGNQRDPSQSISLISTTTKFSGYRKQAVWFAPLEVIRAVEVAQAICRGLAKLHNVDRVDDMPLFLNPSVVGCAKRNPDVGVATFATQEINSLFAESIVIRKSDLHELMQTNPTRDFSKSKKFDVGNSWLLTSHQFRRSLAFYGCSSGFISLPTLRSQFKHMTIQMARYYSNHFENLRTVFGYYNDETGQFDLPSSHFAFEYQMAMPMSVANQLIADLLFGEESLFGGTGSYMDRQKQSVKAGAVKIEVIRAETEKRVKNGTLSYRPTLLGGCTKVGRCDSFLLGDFTACLSCEGAIIQKNKLEGGIQEAVQELKLYPLGSGEREVVARDLECLVAFKEKFVAKVLSDEKARCQ